MKRTIVLPADGHMEPKEAALLQWDIAPNGLKSRSAGLLQPRCRSAAAVLQQAKKGLCSVTLHPIFTGENRGLCRRPTMSDSAAVLADGH
jgi:hypothetical protein